MSNKCPKSYALLMARCLDTTAELRPNFHGGYFSVVMELERLIREEYQKWLPVPRTYRQPEGRRQHPGPHAFRPPESSNPRAGPREGRRAARTERRVDRRSLSG